ncbi:MAG TPA: hypothetical protein PKA00_00285 [Saprospiraceae bacterium]|nr:hypothetical protein [Saprospiraceae bacterium]HMQ81301.1 hypothetical protein [Saprospiraceae bacterium]
MIDHNLIKSGFDLEVLLGADYFLTVLQGAYNAGEIPAELSVGDEEDPIVINIEPPHAVRIITDDRLPYDIEVDIPLALVDASFATFGLAVTISTNQIAIEYRYLDESTQGLIAFFGLISGNPNLWAETEVLLAESLNKTIPLDLVASDVAEMQVLKLAADGAHQAAFGLYLNLNLNIGPQGADPEDSFIPRGDINDAVSFLPENRSFAIGLGKETFPRMANDMWHGFRVENEDGSAGHPIKDEDDNVIGAYKSVSMQPKEGALEVTVKSRIFIDFWPDADVTAKFEFRPKVSPDGKLTFEVLLTEFDADTGLLGDLLGFLIGGLLGAIIGLIMGPIGVVISASLLAGGGIAAVEITEAVLEEKFSDEVEEQAQEAGVGSAFSAFPVRKRLFTDDRDPFFHRHHEVVHLFEEASVNADGMSFAGQAVMEAINEPQLVSLVDKERGSGIGAWNGLLHLIYQVPGLGRIPMPLNEVLRRIPLRQLARVGITPVGVRREKTVVTDICFQSGLDLQTAESVALQEVKVIFVYGYQLIHPVNARPYYRARADQNLSNNFEALPEC